ncbi:hypothetical protein [Lichenifustis flavocetrariae]|uniref:Uncharacterized protein n=1 Tax=Lichenifustis flavocetrariae TaxID=2949735 RepID=A0AA41Z0T6_9HYPH|nr:hypothetical protein [Lichenifustis flavocetrariae]MCW6510871.1 hypothetical protein [Lichenifustis flavocetrariae]
MMARIVIIGNAGGTADLGIHILDPRFQLMWHRTAVPVDPAQLRRLTARHRLTPPQIFDVTADDRGLLVKLGEQKAYRVFPTPDWTFFYKCVGAQLTFEPGDDGRAGRLILDQIAERIEP